MKENESEPTKPITKKEEVQKSNDPHIDQDFEGFPHAPANEELINPTTKEEKITANVEKNTQINPVDEATSDGSGGAFDATENMRNDDDDYSRIDEK
ncbi:MAG: hypothetical protein ABI861_10135 [Panacibacter sp.]